MSQAALSRIALPQLERLLALIIAGDLVTPLKPLALEARGFGASWPALAWLAPLDRAGLEAVLRVAIAERAARPPSRHELVWTGPEAKASAARDTAVVVRQMFSRAQSSVLVAGFAFTGGRFILEPLHEAMRARGVTARLFLHIDDEEGWNAGDSVDKGIERFVRDNWPFGPPEPVIYYDPRTVAAGSKINLHAKCVVVDGRLTLIGSANFTQNAHARNIEVGVLIDDVALATDLSRQWQGLIDEGLVRRAR